MYGCMRTLEPFCGLKLVPCRNGDVDSVAREACECVCRLSNLVICSYAVSFFACKAVVPAACEAGCKEIIWKSGFVPVMFVP